MNPRIQVMLDSRELEAFAAPDEEVAARWRKAVHSYIDSRKGLSADSAVTLCYQAALQVATTVLRAAGYRTRVSATGHHRLTFEALRALGIENLSPLGGELNKLRRRRHQAVYEWEPEDESAGIDPARLDELVARMLPLAYDWLREQRPTVTLDPPPGGVS